MLIQYFAKLSFSISQKYFLMTTFLHELKIFEYISPKYNITLQNGTMMKIMFIYYLEAHPKSEIK